MHGLLTITLGIGFAVRKIYYLMFVIMLGCISCEWQFKTSDDEDKKVAVDRYDRIQSLYLTTGDFSALQ